MKRFLLCALLVIVAAGAFAQQVHFVFLQSDTRKPFYALLNQKTYSSSSIGYIILPKLQNGEYTLRIGFPKNDVAEQEFLLQVKDNDQGFLVKDFGTKGLGLFNLQTLAVQYAGEAQQIRQQTQQQADEARRSQEAVAVQRRNDSLQAIANAAQVQRVNDSLLAVASAKRQQQYQDSLQAVADAVRLQQYNDSVQRIAAVVTGKQPAETSSAIQEEKPRKNTKDRKKSENQVDALEKQKQNTTAVTEKVPDESLPIDSVPPHMADAEAPVNAPTLLKKTFTDTGWHYTYAIAGAANENIEVFIPYSKTKKAPKVTPKTKEANPATTVLAPSTDTMVARTPVTVPQQQPTAETTAANTPFLDFSMGGSNLPKNVSVTTDTSGVKVLHNSNCRAMAEEKDFLTARKKMVSAEGTEKMIAVARKLMKEKCFTTDQIRNLSFLFLTDADRYQFLDASYPFAMDAYRYASLQDLLKDDYYVQRFKAMIR